MILEASGATVSDLAGFLINCSFTACLVLFFVALVFCILWVHSRENAEYYKYGMRRFQEMYDEIKELVDNHRCDVPVVYPEEGKQGEGDEEKWWESGDKPYGEAS